MGGRESLDEEDLKNEIKGIIDLIRKDEYSLKNVDEIFE